MRRRASTRSTPSRKENKHEHGCVKERRKEVKYVRRRKTHTSVPRELTREAHLSHEVGREGFETHANRVVRVDAAAEGAESSTVGVRHGYTWRKSRGNGHHAKGVLQRSITKKSFR